jgi:hypothetical protein
MIFGRKKQIGFRVVETPLKGMGTAGIEFTAGGQSKEARDHSPYRFEAFTLSI